MIGPFNGDPELANEHARFHRLLAVEADRRCGGPVPPAGLVEWVQGACALDSALCATRAPADAVPRERAQTDWAALADHHAGPVRFTAYEVTPEGVAAVHDESAVLAVPCWRHVGGTTGTSPD
jgi:hypothetical protein